MLGVKLKELRKENNLTQTELGKKLGVVKQTVSNWENNIAVPDAETLSKIALFFNVSVDFLLGKSNSPHESGYFYFFFDEEDLQTIFSKRIKDALYDLGLSEEEFKNQVNIDNNKIDLLLNAKGEPTANDLIELSNFLNTSIDYLLGRIEKQDVEEKKLLKTFSKLNEDNKDILIGKAKELLKDQMYSEALSEDMRKAK